jgi:cytidylate kinase
MNYSKIIIAGKRCTGKTRLFWNLQKVLGWPSFSTSQYIRDVMRTYHFTPEQMEEYSQELTHDIDSRIHTLLKGSDTVIIETRAIPSSFQGYKDTFKLLLVASDTARVSRSASREQTTVEKAQKKLIKQEERWIQRMQNIYKTTNLFDKANYDFILDTSPMTPHQVVDSVLAHLGVRSVQTTTSALFDY